MGKSRVIIPAPKSIKTGKEIRLGEIGNVSYEIKCEFIRGEVADEAEKHIREAMLNYCGDGKTAEGGSKYSIALKIDSSHNGAAEEYKIDVTDDGALLLAWSESGLLYAAYTFTELLEERDGCVYICEAEIHDKPSIKRRGLYQETRFGSEFLTFGQWRDIIDYISRKKLNELTIGVYGCWDMQYGRKLSEFAYLPLENTPKLRSYHDIRYYSVKKCEFVIKNDLVPSLTENDFFGDLIAYAKRKNIAVRPLINSLGHNSVLPREYPEISALDENGNHKGFGFCLSNEKTFERMYAIYDEIIDRYLLPNGVRSIHIGMDEVHDTFNIDKSDITRAVSPKCFCKKCSENREKSMEDYVVTICKYLKSRGMNDIHIYHDMLFGNGITKFGFADRLKAEGLDDAVVIDWWSYGGRDNFFRGNKENIRSDIRSIVKPMTGYYAWTAPTATNYCVEDAVELAYRRGLEGVESYTGFEYCNDFGYNYLSEITWNADNIKKFGSVCDMYADKFFEHRDETSRQIRTMLELMNDNITENKMRAFFNYYTYGYIRPGFPIPRNYPGEAFERLKSNEEELLKYLEDVRSRATAAYEYFSSLERTCVSDIWKLLACHYMTNSNEYLELFRVEKEYNSGSMTSQDALHAIGELIKSKEAFMALIEDIRMPETSYTYLRDATIMRQYLIDFYMYIDNCIKSGEKAEIDIVNPKFELSNTFYEIR